MWWAFIPVFEVVCCSTALAQAQANSARGSFPCSTANSYMLACSRVCLPGSESISNHLSTKDGGKEGTELGSNLAALICLHIFRVSCKSTHFGE